MTKKALCVGINDYPYEGNDLNGCVNDAAGWRDLLVNHYGFPKRNVRLLTDKRATKAAILARLKTMVSAAKAGDLLVFTNSSHGTYIADTSGDEPKYDEAICPSDCADQLLVDDELRELFATLPVGVQLTVISDSCFSGTVTRASLEEAANRPVLPNQRRVRFLNPILRGNAQLKDPWTATRKRKEKFPEEGMREILLSGCSDREYSYDALIDGQYHGAMTYYALQAVQQSGYAITWQELHETLLDLLQAAGFNQHPQLEGRAENKQRQIFS